MKKIKIKKQGRWLYKDEEVQKDLLILQEKYKKLGYDFTIDECYNIWYLFSDMLSANWLSVSGDISKSIDYVINNKKCWEE